LEQRYLIEYMNPRYDILDGLRGVAALAVLVYHLFEAIAFAAGAAEQQFYNGFLAVDFFFILSGFVMGYAYDAKLERGELTTGGFIKRRLIRLHPMVIMGVIIGVICFVVQGCTMWPAEGTQVGEETSVSVLMMAMLLALFLIPAPQGLDVRGNTEAFSLNGPHWSLFFEYFGSLLYVLMLRKLPTRWLKVWVFIMAIALFLNASFSEYNSIAYGWSSEPYNLFGGLLRLLFAYPCGLLLARLFKRNESSDEEKTGKRFVHSFTFNALVLVGLMLVPSLSTLLGIKILNPLYQCLCVCICFPMVVCLAARGKVDGVQQKCVSFVGRLSYPLYAIHYPFIYLYIHCIYTDQHPFGSSPWATPSVVFVASIVVAIICLKYYDEPIRKWLSKSK